MRNPILDSMSNGHIFSENQQALSQETFTISGVVNKSFLLLSLVFLGTLYSWLNPSTAFLWVGSLGGFALIMLSMYRYDWAYWIAPVYGLLQGLVLGSFSVMLETMFPGIVMQAMFLTLFTFLSLLFAYKFSLIKVTEQFRSIVVVATLGVFLFTIASLLLSFFGIYINSLNNVSIFGVLLSFAFVIIAAMNLILDFDFIQNAADQNLPRNFEWFASLGMLVTLVWMYIQILQLLAKLRMFMSNE